MCPEIGYSLGKLWHAAYRREASGRVQLAIQEGERSGMLVAEVDSVSFAYDERSIVRDFCKLRWMVSASSTARAASTQSGSTGAP